MKYVSALERHEHCERSRVRLPPSPGSACAAGRPVLVVGVRLGWTRPRWRGPGRSTSAIDIRDNIVPAAHFVASLIYAKIDEIPFDLKTDRYLRYDPGLLARPVPT
jgi:hypothetical protein